jgi:mono/diheme cytochrome c family protein
MTPEQVGQSIFNAKCGRCHGLKIPSEYTDIRWVQIMQVMAMKANLNETEKANVLTYVRANAKKG